MKRLFITTAIAAGLTVSGGTAAFASTVVPGHDGRDGTVNGQYTAVYAYDAEDWYQDLGDGRTRGTVGSLESLDEATLTVCDYQVVYRGDFGDDPALDTGWIRNNIRCHGYDDNGTYNSLYIHESDPRYTGDREPIWGTWEILVETESGVGNHVSPQHHVG